MQFTHIKPNYTMTFSNDAGLVGTLDFNGPKMIFTGDAEESAKVFFDLIGKSFVGRFAELEAQIERLQRAVNRMAAAESIVTVRAIAEISLRDFVEKEKAVQVSQST